MSGVPERVCGGCTVCCRVPPIDTPEFQKQAGVLCRFCDDAVGCSIHATRPPACREWFCGWRKLPLLDDSWRPDRSGVLIAVGADERAAGLAPYETIKFIITDPSSWRPDKAFIGYVGALLAAGVTTFVAVPGPPRHHQLKSLLNGRFGRWAKDGNDAALAAGIVQTVEILGQGPFEPVSFVNKPVTTAASRPDDR